MTPVGTNPSRAGFCLVSIKMQAGGVLIKLLINDDVLQCSTEREEHTTDVGAAVQVISEFLTSFVRRSPGCGRTRKTE
jgi:hypothetical protein